MEFQEAANYLFDLRRYPSRPGIDATRSLLAALDDPHQQYPCVQIAGSNGKGSTARMCERVCREAGLDIGLYTSPHLDDVRERIRVNGRPLTEATLTEFVEQARPHIDDRGTAGEAPTFFETLTALALWAFDRADVDLAVLEVGIGGKHDATSVVDPVASAVTAVTLEHTDILGETVPEIARDMAHVAPTDAPLVTGATGEALATIEDVAGDVLTVDTADASPDVTVEYGGRDGLEGRVSLEGDNWHVETKLPLLGEHQARNAGIAATLAGQAADVAEADLARGLRNAHWPGRFEVMDREPLVVLDGAHNPGGCAALAEALDSFAYDDLHVVVGAMSDKDHRGIARALPPAASVLACEPDRDRAESADVLAGAFEAAMPDATVETGREVASAFAQARERAGPDDCVLVTGSLFCVATARARWTRLDVSTRIADRADAHDALERVHVPHSERDGAASAAVHRSIRTRLAPRQARTVRETMLSVGGAAAVSGLRDQYPERVDVLLSGTLAQVESLLADLDARGFGPLADDLRATLDIDGHDHTGRGYPWEDGTAVMGILNVTPDSFHDGGEYDAVEDAVERAEEMVAAGADIIDIGGESTRPGADPVPVEEERDRVLPVIERSNDLDAMLSIDTRKAEVARAALDAGADVLNDVSGLEDPEMRLLAAERDVPVCVMHSIETPVDPDSDIEYDDVVDDVLDAVTERILLAEKAGLDREQIIVDPGLGFGKSRAESFALLDRLDEFQAVGCPILVGHSHKSMFGLIDRYPDEGAYATVAATALAAERGADIVRVHDVEPNVAAVRTAAAADDPSRFETSDE